MKFIADLHIHSHFSRATSPKLNPENLAIWAKKKGITLLGTGDFTHPGWLSELQEKLIEAENGLFRLNPGLDKVIEEEIPESCKMPTKFLLSGEISCIYKKGERTRKLHHLILMPDMDSAIRFNKRLDRIGNISSDGRPILGLDSRDLLEITLEVSDRAFFIPAHIWTPWFSLFGSKSGFDSIEECFGDLTSHIHALETGLSSDPPMNRHLSTLDGYLLVSNSDAHSPSKLGREANIFDTELDYDHILKAMTHGNGFQGTIEFFPEEGKYHLDGHRKCQVRLHPGETRACKGICPSCGKSLTVGVLHRVYELADRDSPKLSKDFYSLIPLPEILSEIFDCGPATKKVAAVYEDLLVTLGPELHILMDAQLEDVERAGGVLLAKAIDRMRREQVIRQEGYDGEYGVIRLFEEKEKHELAGQIALFGPPEKKRAPKRAKISKDNTIPQKERSGSYQTQQTFLDPVLDPLNAAQRRAVLHRGGHLLIVAGPGTGKTMTLTRRIAHLVRSGEAGYNEILALTFTNKAAKEMRDRLRDLLPEPPEGNLLMATFHGFCLKVLKNDGEKLDLPSPFTICSELDASTLTRQVILESGKGERIAARLLKNLPRFKRASLIDDGNELAGSDLFHFFQIYQDRLRTLGMLDMDDLEVETLRLFKEHPDVCLEYAMRFPKIFVDEYQDTNSIQVELLKMLVHAGTTNEEKTTRSDDATDPYALRPEPCAVSICAIGDPDQAIYGFRGADLRNFRGFSVDFPGAEEVVLSQNYRSTQMILSGSSALMEKEKALEGQSGLGSPIRLASCRTNSEEAEMIVEQIEKLLGGTTYFSLDSGRVSSHEEGENFGFGDIAVLFRLNAQGDALEEAFSRAGIPYIRSGERPLIYRYPVNLIWRFFQALHYQDNDYYLKAYKNLLNEKSINGEELLRQCETGGPLTELIDQTVTMHGLDCSSKESADALRRVKEIVENFDGDMPAFLDALSLDRGIDHEILYGDRTALMSLHSAKGLEWPVVFITGCEDKLIPCTLFGDRDDAEEKRLFYVGMTRACSNLILSHVSRRMINGRVLHMKPSPFLDLLPGEFCEPLERSAWKRKKSTHKQMTLFKIINV